MGALVPSTCRIQCNQTSQYSSLFHTGSMITPTTEYVKYTWYFSANQNTRNLILARQSDGSIIYIKNVTLQEYGGSHGITVNQSSADITDDAP